MDKNLEKFNECFPNSKYREIAPRYIGEDNSEYQKSKAPLNSKILSFDEIKNTPNRIGWIVPKDYIAVDLDDRIEASKLYSILQFYKVNFVFMVGKHGGHFIFKNTLNYGQTVKAITSIGLKIDIRSMEKGYIILPYNDKDRAWGTLTSNIDELPFYLRPLRQVRLNCDFIDMEEGSRNNELLKHFLNLKDYADELNIEEKVNSIKIINKFIFKTPIDERELMATVLRDDMVNRESLSDKEDSLKRCQKLEKLASKFCVDNRVISVNDVCYVFNGKFYKKMTDVEVERYLHENYDKSLLETDRREIIKFIKLKTYVASTEINKNWNEIVLRNGILNLSNMKLQSHNASSYNTIYIDYDWNESPAYSPIIDGYFNQITNKDEYKKQLFYEIVGYCLLQKPIFSKIFILYGRGGTGKSTFLNLLRKLIGDDYISTLSLHDLEKDFFPAELFGKLVNLGDDIDSKMFKDTGMLKSLVSGEGVTVKRMYKDPFTFNNFAKLIYTCNKLPTFNDRTSGLLRRVCLIDIDNQIQEFDPFFLFKITDSDMEYLLYKSIMALQTALKNNKLSETNQMMERLAMFREEQSSTIMFLKDNDIKPTNINLTPVQTLYDLYKDYCDRNGYKALNRLNFETETCEAIDCKTTRTTKSGENLCKRFVNRD